MTKFKNGIIIENAEDFNAIKKSHRINFTREEMENFVLDVTEMLPEELENYSFETLLEIIHEAEWMIFFDYSNGYELRFNDYFTGDFYGCEPIVETDLQVCYIDYEQFSNLADEITIVLPNEEITVKYSLYGNIIEIIDDRIWDHLDTIKDIIKGNVTECFEDDIDKTLPYYKYYVTTGICGGYIMSNRVAYHQ